MSEIRKGLCRFIFGLSIVILIMEQSSTNDSILSGFLVAILLFSGIAGWWNDKEKK